MSQLCQSFGISRQAHYQMLQRQAQGQEREGDLIEWVQSMRQRHPRMGGRKLLHELQQPEIGLDIQIGRDAFFELLTRYDLLVPTLRQRRRTTWSGFWRCPNLLMDLTISRPHQVWVCDITYLETEAGFCYLCLITDAYSRYIVGYDVSTSLAVEGAQRALTMAVKNTTAPLVGLIHHSDHGVQYTCNGYRAQLQKSGILSSMGEVGNCYENAQAERVNGILKLEYGLGQLLLDVAHARELTRQAIWLYNHERPHLALDYRKPVEVHFSRHNHDDKEST
jgi:putative transposase